MRYRGFAKVHIMSYKNKEAVRAECHCGWVSKDAPTEAELFVLANNHALTSHGHPLNPRARS